MLIDSNILIYAINTDSPKHELAQAFLQKNIKDLEIAHQNIFESIRVLTHQKFESPMNTKDATDAIMAIVDVSRIVVPNHKTHYLALELIKVHQVSGNKVFDAYLCATALSNGITTIATDNERDLKIFSISVYNPFTKGD